MKTHVTSDQTFAMNKTSYFPVIESIPVWPENGGSLKALKHLEIRVRWAVTMRHIPVWATSHQAASEYGFNSLTDPGCVWKQRLWTDLASQTGSFPEWPCGHSQAFSTLLCEWRVIMLISLGMRINCSLFIPRIQYKPACGLSIVVRGLPQCSNETKSFFFPNKFYEEESDSLPSTTEI